MADLNNNNSFDMNMGAGLGPAYHTEEPFDFGSSAFTAINPPVMSQGTPRTISPRDIFNDPLTPAPASAAFTNLTSPDLNSPFIDSFDTSPLYNGDGDAQFSTNSWFPLFPDQDSDIATAAAALAPSVSATSVPASSVGLARTVSEQSVPQSTSSSTNSPIILDTGSRKKSVDSSSPSGISKNRRRTKGPLPPIAVDPNDKAAMKRARNTLAARDSRQRKFAHVEKLETINSELETKVSLLEAEVEKWKSIALMHGYKGAV